MKDDFNSSTQDSKKGYSGISHQQGPVELDADWNKNSVRFVEHTNLRDTWQDIVLPNEALSQLKELASQMAEREKSKIWSLITKPKYRKGMVALFFGSNGTGKTMAAGVIANELKLDIYRIDLSQVVNKYIGETGKNLKKVFDAAKQSCAILFFDEADALFRKRTEVRGSRIRYKNIVINYILHYINDYNGLTILATKRKSNLDDIFLNCVKFVIDFPSRKGKSKMDSDSEKEKNE